MPKNGKKVRPMGSRKTLPLSKEQFDFIMSEFCDRGDLRMKIICLLMFKAVRIGDILRTLKIKDIYEGNGNLRDKIEFNEEKTGKLRTIAMRGEKFLAALNDYLPSVKSLPATAPLFYTEKTGLPLKDSGVKNFSDISSESAGLFNVPPIASVKLVAAICMIMVFGLKIFQTFSITILVLTTEIYIAITPKDIEESMKCLEI